MAAGEGGEGQHLGFRVVHQRTDFGKLAASWSRTVSQVAETASALGWAKMVRNTAATISLWDLVRAPRAYTGSTRGHPGQRVDRQRGRRSAPTEPHRKPSAEVVVSAAGNLAILDVAMPRLEK